MPVLAVALSACTAGGGPSDAAGDTPADDASADGEPDGCVDEAEYELGDTPLALTGCAADPAVVVVEVQLDTMQARGHVSTAPEAMVTLTEESMAATFMAFYEDAACGGYGYLPGSTSVVASGSLTVLSMMAGDPYATAVFDSRTGEMAFSMTGDWMSPHDTRCMPDPLADLATIYGAAADPASVFAVCRVDFEETTMCADLSAEMEYLNHKGDMWAGMDHVCWVSRTYEEVWELARHTSLVGAMAACGPYDVFVMGMSGGGGAYGGDAHDVRLVFVLAGHVDQSALP